MKQAWLKYHFKEHIVYFNGTLQSFKKMANLHKLHVHAKFQLMGFYE